MKTDGMSCYKKGKKPIAKHLKGKEKLSDYKSSNKVTKEEEQLRQAILNM